MSVPIPLVRIKTITPPRPIVFSGNQEAPFGGEDLPIPRMGDRFAIDVTTSQLRRDADARHLIAALIEATTDDAIMPLFLATAAPQLNTAAVVDGSDQSGTSLKVRGLYPAMAFRRGEFFSIVHGGRRYVHMIRSQVIAPETGIATLPIWPMLRFLTTDGDVCEFSHPFIEGRLFGFDKTPAYSRAGVEPLQFSIVERA